MYCMFADVSVAVCRSELQCITMCCSVLQQCVMISSIEVCSKLAGVCVCVVCVCLWCVYVCVCVCVCVCIYCSLLHIVLQRVAACCRVLQCIAAVCHAYIGRCAQ